MGQPPHTHTHTTHTGVRPKLPPRLHFCVVASHHTHTHTTHTGVRPKLPPKLHLCVVASHHTHTHRTLVLGPSYLPGCTCVWLPATTTHTHTAHWCYAQATSQAALVCGCQP